MQRKSPSQRPSPAQQSHWHQLSVGGSTGTALLEPAAILAPAAPAQRLSALAGSSPTYLLPALLPKPSSGARERKRGERLSSCSPETHSCGCEPAGQLGEEPPALLAGLVDRCTVSKSLASPGADALQGGVMGFLANPSPEAPQGAEQAPLQPPGRRGKTFTVWSDGAVWMRPLALQTRAAQPLSSAQHGEVRSCLHCKLPGGGGSAGGRRGHPKTPI